MLISELQQILEKAKEEYGDIKVVQYDSGEYYNIENVTRFKYGSEFVLEFC